MKFLDGENVLVSHHKSSLLKKKEKVKKGRRRKAKREECEWRDRGNKQLVLILTPFSRLPALFAS